MSKPRQKPKRQPKRDKRKTLIAVLALLMALLMILPMFSVLLQTAGAVSQSDLESQITQSRSQAADLNAKIKELANELKKIQNNKSKAIEQKNLVEQQINAQQQAIDEVTQTIAKYDQLVAGKEAEVADTQAKEKVQYELFCQRVRAMEESGTVNYWDILFGAGDFSDLLDRATMISEIMDYDNAIMDELAATRQQLQEQQAALEETRSEQQSEKDDLVARKQDLKAKEATIDQLISNIKSDESQAKSAKDALQAESDRVTADIVKKQKELQALLDAGKINFDPGTGWTWPLPGKYTITSVFGPRIHPITGKPGNHTGTDIAAARNTPIHSARGGVVTISTYGRSYGNYVVVQHDNGVATLYAHMNSRAVKEGDVVKQNQVIGYVGTTGSSTGNHLHFEFRLNGTRADALNYYPALANQFVFR